MIQELYNRFVRDRLPKKVQVNNSVPVRDCPLFDFKDHFPNYKDEQITELRRIVEPGDTVVDIAAGRGITTVISARLVGDEGEVHTYEASDEYYKTAKETFEFSEVSDRITLTHAFIDAHGNVFGGMEGAETISPTELPECDVLNLDCEGSEVNILQDLNQSPQHVILETHADYGGHPDDVREAMEPEYTLAEEKDVKPNDVDVLQRWILDE